MAEVEYAAPHTHEEYERHARTYHRFTLMVKWACIHLAATIALLTVWFATPGGFWGGLVTGLAVLGAGVWAMRHGLAHSSEHE